MRNRVGQSAIAGGESRREFAGHYGLELGDAALLDAIARGKIRAPQRAIELIARIGSGDYPPEARELARDALVRLCRGGWSPPPGGITFECEHCHREYTMKRRRRRAAKRVPWEWADFARLQGARAEDEKAFSRDYRRTSIGSGVVSRWLLVCPDCARLTIRRCRHEDAFGRCTELVTSRQYCARHGTSAERAKRTAAFDTAA